MGTINAFLPGDKVYCITQTSVEESFECLACNGIGTVKLCGKSYNCPCCDGRGIHTIQKGYKYTPTEQVTITVTSIYISERKPPMIDYAFNPAFFTRGIITTGPLFTTLKEAQKWCDEQNAKIPEKPFTKGDCYGND